MTGPTARVRTGLPELLAQVAAAFRLGDVRDWSVLTTGYEDCNIDLTTSMTRVVVKIFAADRPSGIAERTAELIGYARTAGVHHPRVHHAGGTPVPELCGHRVMVMDFVPGRTFYDLGRAPTRDELTRIIDQTVRIHTIDATPEFVPDSWSITNLRPLATQLRDVLDPEQRRLVTPAVDRMAALDAAGLPVVLIHGDLTQGNVLLGQDGQITVLDFAVANRFPRIQELAIIAANLTHESPEPLPARADTIAELYSATAPVPLSPDERAALPTFVHASAAMELLGALAEWHLHGNHSPETTYLIGLGMAGLRDCAAFS